MSLRRARSPEKLADWVIARFAPSQGRHNFNEWLRLFRRCIRMRRSYLRTSSRLLTGSFYALMLIMFSSLGPTCAVVVAYATVWAICRSHAVFHGPWCRSSTAVAVGFPVAMLWGWAPGVIVSGLAGMLPTYMLWWPVSSRKGHRVGDEGEPKKKRIKRVTMSSERNNGSSSGREPDLIRWRIDFGDLI